MLNRKNYYKNDEYCISRLRENCFLRVEFQRNHYRGVTCAIMLQNARSSPCGLAVVSLKLFMKWTLCVLFYKFNLVLLPPV